MLLRAQDSALIVVDMQERLIPAMRDPGPVLRNARLLLAAAAELDAPVLVTEQYPKGLGRTAPEIAEAAGPRAQTFEKIHFSSMAEPAFAKAFQALGRRQAVVLGMEAHVCVLQTAAGLMAAGAEAFVVADAVASRTADSAAASLARLAAAGARIVTAEMVAFEWLGRAGTPAFKALLPHLK